jgi:predicted nucleic acid-binding protein
MMKGRSTGLLIETDLIASFLIAGAHERTLLGRLLEARTCYTTFLQAAEIYAAARSEEEEKTVERALFGLKILGASGRYAKTIGAVLSSDGTSADLRSAIVAAMAIESELPIVTETFHEPLSRIEGVIVISPGRLMGTADHESLGAMLDELTGTPPAGV